MKVQVVTTITTTIDIEDMSVEHSVFIAPDSGIPESMASAAVLGAAKSLVLQLER